MFKILIFMVFDIIVTVGTVIMTLFSIVIMTVTMSI
jgi:hypothetical protein